MLVKLRNITGFTLVELTLVLFIITLLLGGLLVPLATKLEQEGRDRTSLMLDEIKETLLGYAVINGRLPCPDCPDGTVGGCAAVPAAERNDGLGDWSGAVGTRTCRTVVGNLPWVELQVQEFDAWNWHFTYQVTPEFARESNTAPCGTPALGVSFELCTPGDIDIFDEYNIPAFYTTPPIPSPTIAEDVPAIVISHGTDSFEPDQTDQQVENYGRKPTHYVSGADILTTYTATDFSDNIYLFRDFERDTTVDPPTRYDDIIMWISPHLLMSRMIVSGKLP
jgi:hypothetical protein